MGPNYPRWKRIAALVEGVIGVVLAGAGVFAAGILIGSLAEGTPKTAMDWIALLFLSLLLLGLLTCIAILIWFMYRLLVRMAT